MSESWIPGSRQLQKVAIETVQPFVSPFTSAVRTTWSIIRHPIRFGKFVEDDFHGLTGALKYLSETVLLLFVVVGSTLRWLLVSFETGFPNFPFMELVFTAGVVGLFVAYSFAFAPVFRFVARSPLKIYAFVASNSYYCGVLVVFIAVVMFLMSVALWIFLDAGDGVIAAVSSKTATVNVSWESWDSLTPLGILFFVFWLLCALGMVAAFVGLAISFCGYVCWLATAHSTSRVRSLMSIVILQLCVAFLMVMSLSGV